MIRKLRPFGKTDWYGWPGAVPFDNGLEPYIGEIYISDWAKDWPAEREDCADILFDANTNAYELTIVADKTGVCIGGIMQYMLLDLGETGMLSVWLARSLIQRTWTMEELEHIGFHRN